MNKPLAALLCCLPPLIVGCAVDQKKAVNTYRDQLQLTLPTTQSLDSPVSLSQALRLSNANNEQLSIQGEAFYRAINGRRRSVAGFLPTLGLNPNYVVADRDRKGGSVDSDSATGDTALSVTADLNINLFNGMRDVNAYWRDTYLIEQRRQDLLDLQQSLLLDVTRAYYQVLVSEASVRILQESLKTQEERLRDTRGRYEAGLARLLDVSQTEAQVSSTRVSLLDAQRDVRNARSLLKLLASSDIDGAPLSDQFSPSYEVATMESLIATASLARNDLRASAAAIFAARREVEVAVGQYYPSVSLDLGAFLYDDVPNTTDWQAILRANLPIFSAGRIEADVNEAWSFFREAQLVHVRLCREVRQQIEQSYNEVITGQKRLDELRVQVTASQAAYDQAVQSYEAGLATNLDRLVAQTTLLNAQLAFASENYLYKIRFLELRRVVGQLRDTLQAMQP